MQTDLLHEFEGFITAFNEHIWAGVIFSLIVFIGGILFRGFVALNRRLNRINRLKDVFPLQRIDGEITMYVGATLESAMGGRNPETLRAYTHTGEVESLARIIKAFQKNRDVKIEFAYADGIEPQMKNIVVLGQSDRSDISRDQVEFLIRKGIRVSPDDAHAYFRDLTGKEYHCRESDKTHHVLDDYGVIMRRETQLGQQILMCGGIHTFATQAAAIVALQPKFNRLVRTSKYKNFVQVVKVSVAHRGRNAGLAIDTSSIEWENLPLINLDNLPSPD